MVDDGSLWGGFVGEHLVTVVLIPRHDNKYGRLVPEMVRKVAPWCCIYVEGVDLRKEDHNYAMRHLP